MTIIIDRGPDDVILLRQLSGGFIWRLNGIGPYTEQTSDDSVGGEFIIPGSIVSDTAEAFHLMGSIAAVVAPTLNPVPDQNFAWDDTLTVDCSSYVADDGGDAGLTYASDYGTMNSSTGLLTLPQSAGTNTVSWTATNSAGASTPDVFDVTVNAVGIAAPTSGQFTSSQNAADPHRIDVDLTGYTIPVGYTLRLYIGMVPFTVASSVSLAGVIADPDAPFTSNPHPEWMDTTLYISYGIEETAAPGSFADVTSPNQTLVTSETVITQTAPPVTAPLTDGATAVDMFVSEGTYTASNGQTIEPFVLADDAVFYADSDPVAQNYAVSVGEVMYFRVTVTASDGATEVFNSADVLVGAGAVIPVLSGLAVTDASDTVSVSSDIICRLYWRINAEGENPDAATIIAGGGTASGYEDLASGANSFTLSLPTDLKDIYQISLTGAVLPDGDASNIVRDVMDINTDITLPALTSPTADPNGQTGATNLGVTSDEGDGVLYWGIYLTAATPTPSQIVAGTGAVVSGSQAVVGSGRQNVANQTGLDAATPYKAHYVHDDAALNRSNAAASPEFTTESAAVGTIEVTQFIENQGDSFTTPAFATGDTLVILAYVNADTTIVQGDCSLGTLRHANPNISTHTSAVWTFKAVQDEPAGVAVTMGQNLNATVFVCSNADFNAADGATQATTSRDWPTVPIANNGMVIMRNSRRTGSSSFTYNPVKPTEDPVLPATEGFWGIGTVGAEARQQIARTQATGGTSDAQTLTASSSTSMSMLTVSLSPA